MICPDSSSSIAVAVGASAVLFGSTMLAGTSYLFTSNTACWIKQGSTAALTASPATAASGSMFVPANAVLTLDGRCGANLSIIQDAASGKASLTHALEKD